MRIVRFAEAPTAPWKNGGGETTELAVCPPGAGFDAFGWRISIARVASDGPFSAFPDVDRTLTLIEGAGMDLTVEGVTHHLTPGSPPLAFPGDVAAAARLVRGPIRDLNVMTRRSAFTHRVDRVDGGPVRADAAVTAIVALDAVDLGGTRLARGDTLFPGDGDSVTLSGPAAIVRIDPA